MSAPARRTLRPRRIAVVGAGPIGLETALYGTALGHEVTVYERGRLCENLRRWSFVELFSPWSLDVSALGVALLRRSGRELPPGEAFPKARELVEHYLAPLASLLGERVRTQCEVVALARCDLLKSELVEPAARRGRPFRLLLRSRDGGATYEEDRYADVVIDASGVYSNPGALGEGGAPAVGELEAQVASDRLQYHVPDVLGAERGLYAGKTTLLVGAGASAATALAWLVELARAAGGTRVIWARRDTRAEPVPLVPDDPLPQRDRLARFANAVARDPPECVRHLRGVSVARIAPAGVGFRVDLRRAEGEGGETVTADRVLALVGYRPDPALYRELQVHLCYASEGPMKLAAALLSAGGGSDCLAVRSFGASVLANPEPDFYVVGHKSFGRRSDFLLRAGVEQVRDVFRLIEEDEALDLYEEARQEEVEEP